jgi:hypothetical protein
VRFQVLTAASMMFRAVFWVVLPCPEKDNSALRLTRRHFPTTLIPSRYFNEARSRAKLHPLHILSRYTSLSLLLPPPAHCHWPVTSLSSLTTTGHLGTRHLYKPRSFRRLAYSSLMMEAVRTSETSVDNHFTRQYNPEDSSEHP